MEGRGIKPEAGKERDRYIASKKCKHCTNLILLNLSKSYDPKMLKAKKKKEKHLEGIILD